MLIYILSALLLECRYPSGHCSERFAFRCNYADTKSAVSIRRSVYPYQQAEFRTLLQRRTLRSFSRLHIVSKPCADAFIFNLRILTGRGFVAAYHKPLEQTNPPTPCHASHVVKDPTQPSHPILCIPNSLKTSTINAVTSYPTKPLSSRKQPSSLPPH